MLQWLTIVLLSESPFADAEGLQQERALEKTDLILKSGQGDRPKTGSSL
jgi:hypothetical protein